MSEVAEQLPCTSCGGNTEWRCSDCAISGIVAAVCPDSSCRDYHEAMSCSATSAEQQRARDLEYEQARAARRWTRSEL